MDLCSKKTIAMLLESNGIHQLHSLGQNFLIAPWVPDRIAEESGIDRSNGVLEIGAGIGCLTENLAAIAGKVIAVELDRRLIPILEQTVGFHDNVTVLNRDIMKLELTELDFSTLTPCVCANLPYKITTPVLTKLIESKLFSSITVMIQREVAQRITAHPSTPQYGAFSVYCQFYTEPKVLFDVPPACFEPAPKVTSSVVRLRVLRKPPIETDEKLFFKIVRSSFGQRRKTLSNSLYSGLNGDITKDAIIECISKCGISLNARGETLTIDSFAALTEAIGMYLRGK